MRRYPILAAAILVGVAAAAFALTAPEGVDRAAMPDRTGDAKRGERIFVAAGCASCHAAKGAKDADKLLLGGGQRFETDFGTFVAPNISSDRETGIGRWSYRDFAAAMLHGTGPDGRHLYPAFPYSSYARMTMNDVVDLRAFLDTVPPVRQDNPGHELDFPYNIRRALGFWKLLYLDASPVRPAETAEIARGRYLVEALGHCGECHTPRDMLGGPRTDRWLAGGPNPDGEGKIPNITPHADGIGGWTAEDIAYYLESGFTPEYDSAGGSMVAVIANTATFDPEDRAAIAAYLMSLPAVGPE